MAKKNVRFKKALDQAVSIIAADEEVFIKEIEARIADATGYEVSTVQRWRRGLLPTNPAHFVFLVRHCMENEAINDKWAKRIIYCVGDDYYPKLQKDHLYQEVCSSTAPLPEPIFPHNIRGRVIQSFIDRWDKLCEKKDLTIASAGSVYLDVQVRPSQVLQFQGNQGYVDDEILIDDIEYKLGGSCVRMGEHIRNLGLSVHLFSAQGRSESDPHTDKHRALLANLPQPTESNLSNNLPRIYNHVVELGNRHSLSGTTVLIEHSTPETYTIMYTQAGVLSELKWSDIKGGLDSVLKTGGYLYTAGYFKTNLRKGFTQHLRRYQDRGCITCIDHGRFIRGNVLPKFVQDLNDAFQRHKIDIYFCTLRELWNLFHYDCPDEELEPLAGSGHVRRILANLIQDRPLPLITVVRDEKLPKGIKAYLIVGNKVEPVTSTEIDSTIEPQIASQSAFNAAFIAYLARKSEQQTELTYEIDFVRELARNACIYALEYWMNY